MNRTVGSYPVSIFIAGLIGEAIAICRAYCDEIGYCVTVSPTAYAFRGGWEAGVVVGLINYGRFPAEPEAIFAHAYALAKRLCEGLNQESYTIQAPDKTLWVSHRAEDNPAPAIEAAIREFPPSTARRITHAQMRRAINTAAQKGPA